MASSAGFARMGLIPEETIQQLVAASDIVAVISSYFPLKRAGANFKALCPFHNERSPSFMVNPARGSFHCFGCGAGGGVIKFVELYEHVSFPDALRRLAERAGIAIIEVADAAETASANRQRKDLLALHRDIAQWFHELLLKDAMAEAARRYWKSRGLEGQHARRWQIGYAPPHAAALLAWSNEKKYSQQSLVEAGLISLGDEGGGRRQRSVWFRFGGRLMFPICNEHGDVVGFSGRALQKDTGAAKYVNSPETPIFNKGRVFFGLDKSRRSIAKSQCAIICEGQLDLISCFENGIENVVAPLGTAFTNHHARTIRRLSDEAVLCFDSDDAGYKAAGRAFRELARAGVFVRVAELPGGEDPDSLIRARGIDALREKLKAAASFFDFQMTHLTRGVNLSGVRERLRVVDELAGSIASLTEKAAQEDAINTAATRLAVPTADIRGRVARAARDLTREGEREDRIAVPAREAPLIIANKAVRMLCKLALTDVEARVWLLNSGDSHWLADLAETEVLTRVWQANNLDPGHPASVSAFVAALPPPEQALVSALITEESPARGVDDARAAFFHLKTQRLKNLIDQKQARLKMPGLPPEDLLTLTQEVVECHRELRHLKGTAATPASLVPF
ncbi:MAG: DNA primase [Verrucomicrobiales bacterium]